jgi:hypothetical protein
MIAIVVALAAAAGFGWLRPRWSSLAVAPLLTALAFAWLLLHEDIPGDPTGLDDIVWYVGMSLLVGAAFALACTLGIVTRRYGRTA